MAMVKNLVKTPIIVDGRIPSVALGQLEGSEESTAKTSLRVDTRTRCPMIWPSNAINMSIHIPFYNH